MKEKSPRSWKIFNFTRDSSDRLQSMLPPQNTKPKRRVPKSIQGTSEAGSSSEKQSKGRTSRSTRAKSSARKNEMRPEYYEAILERLRTDYGLTLDRTEHPAVTEFYEGPLPLLKLLMSAPEEGNP